MFLKTYLLDAHIEMMAIEIFWSPKKVWGGILFFPEMVLHAPRFFCDQKILVAIQHTPIVEW
jgi:hypothetical protein